MTISAQVQSLRQLQQSLNEAIDRCVAIDQKNDGQPSSDLANSLVEVQELSARIKIASMHPAAENLERAFAPIVNVCIRIAIDLNLFELIDGPITIDELAKKTSADPVLLLRILRCLRVMHYFDEGPQDHYRATELGKSLRIPNLRDMMKSWFDLLAAGWIKIPAWYRANGFNDMQNLSHNVWITEFGDNFFDYLAKQPELQADFDSACGLQDFQPENTIPQYPFSEVPELLSKEADAVTLVDVGGGLGQYLTRILKKHPELSGRFIMQDLPKVIAEVDKSKVSFEPMAIDFFTPQPVHGAKFYHLRGILHDWPETECIKILKNLLPAFKKGYSKLLVQSLVLVRSHESPFEVTNDINMWTCCGIERDEQQFAELLEKGGFRIDRIIRPEVGAFSIIEASPM